MAWKQYLIMVFTSSTGYLCPHLKLESNDEFPRNRNYAFHCLSVHRCVPRSQVEKRQHHLKILLVAYPHSQAPTQLKRHLFRNKVQGSSIKPYEGHDNARTTHAGKVTYKTWHVVEVFTELTHCSENGSCRQHSTEHWHRGQPDGTALQGHNLTIHTLCFLRTICH